jgi:hypothetical protein
MRTLEVKTWKELNIIQDELKSVDGYYFVDRRVEKIPTWIKIETEEQFNMAYITEL